MTIFSHTLTPRLQYIADFLSKYFAVSIRIICDEEKYKASPDPYKINYSFQRLEKNEIWIHSHVLLFETAVRPVKVDCFDHHSHLPDIKTYKAFFQTEGDTGFDIFAAIFYLLTRYEEYLPHKKDAFGRYAHEESIAFKEEFLHLPLINIWLEDFKVLLRKKFPQLKLAAPAFRFLPTYDIDIVWSYRHKGLQRNAGAILKLFFTVRWKKMASRIRVLREKEQDPYDAYEWMDELHRKYSLHPIYFFLVAQHLGRYDKNIDVNNAEFRHLLQQIALKYKVGLHPSFASNQHPTLLPREKNTLEQITGHPVHISRQHFIMLDLPATYRRLITLGVTEDYSMGYGNINGFRASVATPFYWYDVKNDFATNLLLYPFCFMEATAFYEYSLTPEEALNDLMFYYNCIKTYGGTMVTIWHNSFLGTDPDHTGWREEYEKFVATVTAK